MPIVTLEEFFQSNKPLEAPEARNAIRTEEGRIRVPIANVFPATAPQQDTEPGLVGGAFSRGLRTVQSDFLATTGLIADAFGYDEAAQGFYNRALEIAESRDKISRRIPRVEDIKGPLDVGVFALETLIENAPLLASIAVPGGIAAKIAGVGGRTALAGTTRAAQVVARKRAAGITAAFLSDVGLQTGESVNIAREAGGDPLDIRVVGSGLGKGALDFVPILVLMRKLGLLKKLPLGETLERNIAGELVERGFIRRAVGNVGTLIAAEVPTETAQEIINIALDRSISAFEGQLTAEEKSQLLNAAAGAAAFGLLGVPAAVVRPQGGLRPATEDELHAADAAADPQAEVTPSGLFDRPVIRVTPEGEVVLPSQEVEDASYDPALDRPRTGTEVQQAIQRALGRDELTVDPLVATVTEDGIIPPELRDTHSLAADAVRQIPEIQRTPIEQGIVTVDDAKNETTMPNADLIPLPLERQREYPVPVQTLLQARDDTFLAEGFRRTADGQLTKAGKKRVAQIDKRITAIVERLGLPNPLDAFRVRTIQDAERELPTHNAEEEARRQQRPDQRLTPAESALLERLEAKDIEEGLSLREEDERARLIAKREGEERADRQKLTAEEIAQLREEGAQLGDEESVQVGPNGELLRVEETELIRKNLLQIEEELNEVRADARLVSGELSQIDDLSNIFEFNFGVKVSDTEGLIRTITTRLFQGSIPRNANFVVIPGERGFTMTRGSVNRSPQQMAQQIQEMVASRDAIFERAVELDERFQRLISRQVVLKNRQFKFRTGEKARGMPVTEVKAIVDRIASKLVRGPNFIVVDSTDPSLGFSKRRRDKLAGYAKGAFLHDQPNNVYIFADTAINEADVVQTTLHETLAHFGLRAYFTEEELEGILRQTYKSRGKEIQDRFGVPKNTREARNFAEEFIAEIAENGTDMSFLERVIAWVRRAFRKVVPNMKLTDNDIRFMLRDVSKFLSGGIPQRNTGGITRNLSTQEFMRTAGTQAIESVLPEIDTFRTIWGAKFATGILTPLQIAEKFPIPGAREYVELTQLWSARRGVLTRPAAELAERWMKMPRREAQVLAQAMFELSEESDRLERRLTQEEVVAIMRRVGASELTMTMWREIDESFSAIVDQLQGGLEKSYIRGALRDVAVENRKAAVERIHQEWTKDQSKAGKAAFYRFLEQTNVDNPFVLGAKLNEVANEMAQLRNRNYFPRMRFGPYALVVRAQQDITFRGKNFKEGEVVSFETFESLPARKDRRKGADKEFGDKGKYRIQENLLQDEEFSFLGMPPALFEALEKNLGLEPEQKAALKELYFRYSPGKAFLRHLTKRKGIAGYSVDAMRVYASYMMNAANHIARVEFNEDMSEQQQIMAAAAKSAEFGTRFGVIANYFRKHFQYIMNPEEDYAGWRAMGFLWYLGFNVKSALVNLTQVPMVAYPFLAHHYGDARASAAIARAYKAVSQKMLGKAIFDQETDEDLQRGIDERFLDESLATELAGLGESDVLQRLMPEDANIRLLNNVSFYGSFLFKHAEKYNREVVFIAARELALKRGADRETAFKAARKAVQATMFEYAKWNRPAFMRGKKSVFFLFWQFMQHLSFLAYGGEGKGPAMRVWGMLLLAAGMQGLPFAENIFDLLDFTGTQWKQITGSKDPQVRLREDIRELASTITDRPDLVMHGLSRNFGLGPAHLLSILGIPVPSTDISGSISAGRVIPGTEQLLGPERDPNAKFGRTLVEVFGPVVGVGYGFWKALESDDPDTWKVWERAMPSALQGASKAARRTLREEETFRGGGTVAEFDPTNPEHQAENIAQAFGFATTRLNQRFELRASQEYMKRYWTIRRSVVMENFAFALLAEDQETMAAAQRRLQEFNRQAPSPGLRIRADALRQSIRERFRRGHLREVGLPSERAFIPLYKRLEETFPEGAPER